MFYDRKILLIFSLFCSSFAIAAQSIGNALTLYSTQQSYYEKKNFKILGVIQIDPGSYKEQRLIEFSGIAWDQDQQSLIILSDRGFIINTRPVFNKNQLIDLELLSYYPLLNAEGKALKHKASDSEGLALINSNNNRFNDTELLVSFERKPRIERYSTEGELLATETISNELNNIKNYQSANKALEAITRHGLFNIITGPERPLTNNNNLLSLHTLNNKKWLFKPENENYGSLVGLTTLPNNNIIALERIFPGVFAGLSNVIHLLTLERSSLKKMTLLKIQPKDGYFNDNFEGISWHEKNRFFMISDDNDNLFQRTLLVYFEIPSLNITENE